MRQLYLLNWPINLSPLPRPVQQQIDDGLWVPFEADIEAAIDALHDESVSGLPDRKYVEAILAAAHGETL